MSLDVDPASVEGQWWRHIPAGEDVRYRPPDPSDNRWQRGAAVEALYFAESPETAWAEFLRYLAEAGLPPDAVLPRDMWKWEISLDRVADLHTGTRLGRVGLPIPRPTAFEWPTFQPVGEALYRENWVALLAPSAARPDDGRVLCVFREADRVQGTTPVPPPERHDALPVIPTGLRT